MREPLEIVTASRIQNMVEIRKKNTYFVTKLLFRIFGNSSFGALGVESPHGGAINATLYYIILLILRSIVVYIIFQILSKKIVLSQIYP